MLDLLLNDTFLFSQPNLHWIWDLELPVLIQASTATLHWDASNKLDGWIAKLDSHGGGGGAATFTAHHPISLMGSFLRGGREMVYLCMCLEILHFVSILTPG